MAGQNLGAANLPMHVFASRIGIPALGFIIDIGALIASLAAWKPAPTRCASNLVGATTLSWLAFAAMIGVLLWNLYPVQEGVYGKIPYLFLHAWVPFSSCFRRVLSYYEHPSFCTGSTNFHRPPATIPLTPAPQRIYLALRMNWGAYQLCSSARGLRDLQGAS
jgi:hypothetical protein